MRTNLKKRIIGISVISIFLIILLAGYWKNYTEWSRKELSSEKKQEIETAWREQMNDSKYKLTDGQYYGTCGDCIILFSGGMLQAITKFTVAGEEFAYQEVFSIWVYKAGELIELEEAYERGWLTKENVADIAEYHRKKTKFKE